MAQNGGPQPFRSEGPVAPRRRFIFYSIYFPIRGTPVPLAGRGPTAAFSYCFHTVLHYERHQMETKRGPAAPSGALATIYFLFILLLDSGFSATEHPKHAGRPAGSIYFLCILLFLLFSLFLFPTTFILDVKFFGGLDS